MNHKIQITKEKDCKHSVKFKAANGESEKLVDASYIKRPVGGELKAGDTITFEVV